MIWLLLAACGAQAPAATTAPSAPTNTVPTMQPTVAVGQASPTQSAVTPAAAATAVTITKVNLNTVTPEQILKIPNAGNNMIREFQEYRPWVSILQFRREIGKYVGAQQVAEYEKYVYVPINIATADAATLQQIPGVDKTIADQLIAARPYATNDAFLSNLAKWVSADQVAVAKSYLVAP